MGSAGVRLVDEAEVARQYVVRLARREPHSASSALAELLQFGYEPGALRRAHDRIVRDSFHRHDARSERAIRLLRSALDGSALDGAERAAG